MGSRRPKTKKKKKVHVTYNRKEFLTESINSTSAIHAKIMKDGIAMVRLTDCHGSIRWWNDLNSKRQIKELLQKVNSAMNVLTEFKEKLEEKIDLPY